MIRQCDIYPNGISTVILSDGSIASVPFIHVVNADGSAHLQKRMKVWFFDIADKPISDTQQERLIVSQMRRVGAKRAFYDDLLVTMTQHTQDSQLAA
jgi:hypothetical protein